MPPKRPPPRKRQTKINFSPTAKPATQPIKPLVLSDSEDELSPHRPAKRRRTEEGTARGMRLSLPVQPSGRAGMFGSLDLTNDTPSGTSHSDETESDVKRRKEKKEKKDQKKSKKGGEASKSIEVVVPKKSRQRKSRQQRTPEEESTGEIQVIPRRKSQPRSIRKQPVKAEGGDEEDEDDAPRTRPRRLRTTARDSSSEDVESEEEQSESEQEDENEQENQGNSEEEELKEDLAFLRSSPVPDRGRLRSTGNKVKSDREKALEALKKRRAGTNEPSSSAATPGRRKPVIIESDSESGSDLDIIEEEKGEEADLDDGDEEVDEIEDDDDDDAVNVHDVFQETNEDEDFIDDDEEGLLGAPAEDTQMPLAFTGLSTAKPRDLFKYAIEWSVHKKINPSFASDDEIYVLTFRKLNDEVNGLANSKFHSSAWTSDFSRAIKARPDLLVNELSTGMKSVLDPHCEACNRKNHVASWEISLTGLPYNYNTLEPLAEESGENSDSDSSSSSSSLSSSSSEANLNGEKPTYNEVGERIPPASKTFTLGSTCKANAQVAHTLYHWRYHLHGWVVGYLEREGYFKPDQLVKREKWSDRKRSKKANKIVDKMEKEGEIKRLHRLYKQQVDFAVEAENEYKKGWGRRG